MAGRCSEKTTMAGKPSGLDVCMHYYRVTIAYKGTHYFGWQTQSADSLHEARPTVEGTILNALKKITNYQACTISAASRTDAGVHAKGQTAKITIANEIGAEFLMSGLNSLLPADIRILQCATSAKSYQPNRGSISKEYHYYFLAAPVNNVATCDIALHLPLENFGSEQQALLRRACQLFVGSHDFYNFSSRDKRVRTSVREIFYCDIHQASFSPMAEDMFYLKIIGDGFLKYMVRYLMGALVALARERITLDEITSHLRHRQAHKLSPRARAKGLHLIHVEGSQH